MTIDAAPSVFRSSDEGSSHKTRVEGRQPKGPPFVPQPQSVEETGLDFSVLLDLCVKSIYFAGRPTARQISAQLTISFQVLEEVLLFLKREQLAEVVGSSGVGEQLYQYALTARGMEKAEEALSRNQYVGPAPVPFQQYVDVLHQQTITEMRVSPADVQAALAHMVLDPGVARALGPAVNSGRSMLLYGASGNGKSTITAAMRQMLAGSVLVPHAVDINGYVVKVFDPRTHQEVPPPFHGERRAIDGGPPGNESPERRRDRRWVIANRPLIAAGGELTLRDLELRYSPTSKFYIAPLQMKANSGVLVIDDFGRQIIQPRELLNRWIVPMEEGVDHLALQSGEVIEVPFDVLLVFSTNIPPFELGDEAFFRRIRHKIEVPNPTREEFVEIFRAVCEQRELAFPREAVDYLIERYYVRTKRPFKGCHPRDIVDLVIDICTYEGSEIEFTEERIDAACASYFVDLEAA